ncbi:MAG: hypothetical protein GY742_22125 [Hyphomicrobiales bacterium]|nr:hypothetical protein [Hyphomicrobiales bacterium]
MSGIEENQEVVAKWHRLSHWRDVGFMALVRHIRAMFLYRTHYWLSDRRFESLEKIATRGTVYKNDLSPVNATHADLSYEYGASPRLIADWLLDALEEDLNRYSFIDYGSGRGRVLLTAAGRPFRSVHGIEFCDALHKQAEINIAGYPDQHLVCQDVQSVCCDALDYALPDSDCILYFFNPFKEVLLDKVVRKSLETARANQRRIIIIYYNAKHDQPLVNNTGLKSRPLSPVAWLKLKLLSPHPVQIYDMITD